jgi:hypothetical protein
MKLLGLSAYRILVSSSGSCGDRTQLKECTVLLQGTMCGCKGSSTKPKQGHHT